MKDKRIIKLDQDDILEILIEYLAEKYEFGTFNSRAILLGQPDKDLRLVAIIGDLADQSIETADLEQVDRDMDFNGDHSNMQQIEPDTFVKVKIKDC